MFRCFLLGSETGSRWVLRKRDKPGTAPATVNETLFVNATVSADMGRRKPRSCSFDKAARRLMSPETGLNSRSPSGGPPTLLMRGRALRS